MSIFKRRRRKKLNSHFYLVLLISFWHATIRLCYFPTDLFTILELEKDVSELLQVCRWKSRRTGQVEQIFFQTSKYEDPQSPAAVENQTQPKNMLISWS